MEHPFGLLGLAAVLFASTNLDDVFVLLAFFADPRFRTRQVVVGQCLGLIALYGASVIASLLSLVVAPAYIGLLGLAPIAMGVKQLWDLSTRQGGAERSATAAASHSNVISVAALTIANGGDNLSVYTPIFATRTGYEIGVIGAVFAVMTALWLLAAHWLTHHRSLGAPLRRYGHRVVPFVLIALGGLILYESGTFGLLAR
jgi:cadmium resistance protein CadD (predicted permease)